ncbi:DUF3570 domain-containing protein [Chryseobacterium daecheongense]|uniref:DUF3570 domain-containing protein n=1 Tax=Chryseobacterium daecheongense TaxID=192389 RepID=A0A3N0VV15_9FLAO|nr:DUF3570 domain-containing protein [Chryseobacterium daecheongense]ROH95738.1 DUF3570 domain-containing protein [Chryseobacterium daecheongense]TDX91877.1 uncharacterized protein DUF3570 [Chryseobacterium daecheongense]
MKKIIISIIALFGFMNSKAQETSNNEQSRKLTLDEANLVSSYYHQDGNNSAVTGGIGSEKLTDFSNTIDVVMVKYDKKQRKNKFDFSVGVDHYSSASSDMIDLKANSSASHADNRIYPSFNWSRENETKGSALMGGVSFSTEFDYQSYGATIGFAQKTANRMGEFTAKFQAYLDQVKMIAPIELRTANESEEGSNGRNTFALSLAYSQIINQNFQVEFLADGVQQTGFLSLPFHRVYFADNSVHQETLPDKRFKLPLGVRANYFLGDHVILRAYYRYYTDDWGLKSNTLSIETPVKISPFVSVSPFYRYYSQTAAKYFAPYQQHTAFDDYYTSNYDLSKFDSHFYGAGIRFNPKNGLFGIERLNMLEIRYGHYTKSVGMKSDIISLNLRFK